MISAALMADVHRQFGSKTFQAPDTQHTQKALVYFGISPPNIRGARHKFKKFNLRQHYQSIRTNEWTMYRVPKPMTMLCRSHGI